MKFNIDLRTAVVLLIMVLATSSNSYAQDDSAALAAADTSRFSINSSDGWLLYNSSVYEHGADSVQLALIIRHENNIAWTEEHYIGKIKYGALKPKTSQTLLYYLISDQFSLRVDENGKCYFRLVSGNAPTADPTVIPIIVYYKK
jgi:hypothetical protein